MSKPEVWLRGPIPDIPFLLQPAAHALLQTAEELEVYLQEFPEDKLWQKVYGRASVGFHLRHLTGVLDRLITYAAAKELSEEQLTYLKNEAVADQDGADLLLDNFRQKVAQVLAIFKNTSEEKLREHRTVGRKKLPSSVLGLYFHAAEHSQRHLGQLLVTVSVLKENRSGTQVG
ncbi:DinB superfamily protein [Cyclobacterium lianum]|uniref:DinB superfamily protein n=1 Tax=Cyclobacterium lianum TaxID=388280 RepID=A0A1M7HRI6_9BACT|nr:DinB family protein [Cyclobacterium lianum]SHM31019.1 DinB superfamily protein [Cyclobacterium lianum]